MQNLSRGQLINLFTDLGVSFKEQGHKIKMLCPFHPDTNWGNCDFNIDLQRGFCLSCKTAFNAITLTTHQKGFPDNRVSYAYLKSTYGLEDQKRIGHSFANLKLDEPPKVEALKQKSITEIRTIPIKVEDYHYLKERRYTQEWVDKFSARLCISGFYKYYMVTPIQDAKKYVNTFEARRIQAFEIQSKILNVTPSNEDRVKAMFKSYLTKHNIKLDDYVLTQDDKPLDNPLIFHCLLPKAFYPGASLTTKPVIWNEKNLDRTQPLWLCEGLGSVPRIWKEISENVSCTFGSIISEDQIETLNEFPQINLIIDNDVAGFQMFLYLKKHLLVPLKVADTVLKDTHNDFSKELLEKPLLSPYRYLLRFNKPLESLVIA